ncbi:hypothetical protein [Streptomyces sp. ISL-94]|uniref:hypothetical protein n=1 Tax=Streptomyces sp. ISL-94 TaxID=2819190 RepID=UPI001BE69808|nr:hypothetical protein [Streptomyces sp. ISL-94]MBT2480103.1 hypothetical protein [Streptomyces sp. ISL-94]
MDAVPRHVPAIPSTGDGQHLAVNVAVGALHFSGDEPAALDALHQRNPYDVGLPPGVAGHVCSS